MTDLAYTIDDGEKRHEASSTFQIPPLKTRKTLKPGYFAKLIFLGRSPDLPGERMWVKISKVRHIDEKIIYYGELNNDPRIIDARCGDEVMFEPKHVIDILGPKRG